MANTEKRITAKMVLDSTGYNDKLKGLNAEMKKHQAELKLAGAGIKSFGQDSNKLKSIQESLSKQVELHTKKVDMYKQAIEKSSSKMKDNIQQQKQLKESLSKAQSELKKVIDTHGKELQSYIKNREELSKLNKEYEIAKKKYGENSVEAKKLKEQINKLENEQKKLVVGKEKEVKAYEKAKQEVEKTTKEYEKNEKAIETNAKQVQGYETNLAKAEAEMVKTQGELNKINNELEKQNSKWLGASDKLKDHGERLQNIGEKITGVGTKMASLSTPIAVVGGAAIKLGMDYEASMSNVSALSGSTGEDLEELSNKAREMGAKTSKSAKDAADGMSYMSLAGWKQKQIIAGIEPVLRLSEAANIDLARASALTTDSMSTLGLTVKDLPHYLDIVAQSARNSNTDIDQMAECYIKCGGMIKNLNIPLEESAICLDMLANKGVKGSEAGKAFSAVLINLTAPAGQAKDALKKLGVNAFDSKGKFKGLTNVLQTLKTKLGKLTEAQRNQMLAMIGGKEHVSHLQGLLDGLGTDYDGLKQKINGADGALMDMATTMQNNNKGSITQLKSATEELGLKIYDVLKPSIASIIQKVQEWTDKLNNMTPEQQKHIVQLGKMALAVTGATLAIGKLSTGVGAVFKIGSHALKLIGNSKIALKGLSTASKVAGAGVNGIGVASKVAEGGIAAATGGVGKLGLAAKILPMICSPAGIAVAAVGVAGVIAAKKLSEDAVPKIDLYADKVETVTERVKLSNGAIVNSTKQVTTKISQGTKKAVKAYMDLDTKATESLNHMYTETTMLTEENSQKIIGTYDEMGKQVLQGQKKHNDEQYKELESFFKLSSALTYEEEQNALAAMKYEHQTQEEETKQSNKRIQEILKTASKEKRALTKDEVEEINKLQDKQKQNAVKALSETEIESKVILERIKNSDKRLTAEQASAHIQELNKCRDKAVKAAEDEYSKRVAAIIRQRDETKTISKDQADKLIKEAERQKKDTIKKAEDQKQQVVKKMKEQNKDLEDSVDTSNGKIKSNWDRLKGWFSSNPIVRWIKSKIEEPATQRNVGQHWTGTSYFKGGLTTLHERGWELYDLPQGTKVYNHEASERMVTETAEQVATKVANSVLKNFKGLGNNGTQTIIVPVKLDGKEIARVTAKPMSEELSMLGKRGGLGYV